MFEAKLNQAKLLKSIVDAVRETITEANFEISASGMELQSMDSAHVALVLLRLDAEGFEQYRCDRTFTLGLNLINLSKVLKAAGNDDSVSLRTEETSDRLSITLESPSGERVSMFDLKQMELNVETLGIPEAEYDAVVTMPAADFQRICKDLTGFGETIAVSVVKGAIKFHVSGDVGDASVTVTQFVDGNKGDVVKVEMNEPVALSFSGKYFNSFAKAASLSTDVAIHLSKNTPVMLHYKADGVGHVRYYLAPKIEEGEMEE